jgi:hypothetical protein
MWTYTTILNIVFLVVAAALVVCFLRTGGPAMLRMMNASDNGAHGDHGTHDRPAMHHPDAAHGG